LNQSLRVPFKPSLYGRFILSINLRILMSVSSLRIKNMVKAKL